MKTLNSVILEGTLSKDSTSNAFYLAVPDHGFTIGVGFSTSKLQEVITTNLEDKPSGARIVGYLGTNNSGDITLIVDHIELKQTSKETL